jgi:RNA polymerase sigma-70 factor (ECF subfamily)
MSGEQRTGPSSGSFPTTAWAFIRNAQQLEATEYVSARNDFLTRYWKPVFCFLRAKGHPPERAEELTQGFFERFLRKDSFRKADQEKGRFRTFLLTVLDRFLSDQQSRKRLPHQKRFEQKFVSVSTLITDEDRSFEPSCHETPETIFMRQWAVALVRSVQEQLKHRCEAAGKPGYYRLFAAKFIENDLDTRVNNEALAERFDLSIHQVRYALDEARGWFAELLRSEVRQHVT